MLVLCATAQAQLYKCTDASGAISYQDQPCADTQQQEVRTSRVAPPTKSTDPFEAVFLQVPGIGEAVIPVFEHMEYLTRVHGEQAATIAIRAKEGHRPMELQMTFLPNRQGDPYSVEEVEQVLGRIDLRLVPQSGLYGEKWTFATQIGDAQMRTSVETQPRSFSGSKRIYDTSTAGYVLHSKVVVAIKIFNSGGQSDELRWALRVVNAFQVAAAHRGD